MSIVEHPASHERLILPPLQGKRRPSLGLVEGLRVAVQGLTANKLRSFLTMLGIIIGVSSVIVMVALGQGVAEKTQESIRKMGTNVLTVIPNSSSNRGVSQGLGTGQNLVLADADLVRRTAPSVKAVSAEYRGSGTAKFRNENTKTTIYGAGPEYFEIRNMPLAEGRIFTDDEVKQKAKVVVIGENVRADLFGDLQAVGKYIKLNGQNFRVIGVVEPRGASGFRSPDDQVTVPVTTAMRRIFGVDYLSSMSVQAINDDKMFVAQEEVEDILKRAHKIDPEEAPDVRVFNQADLSESMEQQTGFLQMLLSGIAAVSLVVGGIGIMNIMLVSVTERTREIGIRKAIGAKRRDILYQFLIESITLSVVGGLIGIGGAIALAIWAAKPNSEGGLGFPMKLTPEPILISFFFAAFVGVFFGIYPAIKASRLDPIEALRYE